LEVKKIPINNPARSGAEGKGDDECGLEKRPGIEEGDSRKVQANLYRKKPGWWWTGGTCSGREDGWGKYTSFKTSRTRKVC